MKFNPTPWLIIDFAHLCCGLGPNGKLAMLVAYFDESGTHGASAPVTTVSGLVGSALEWSRLERPWKKALGDFPCFHATDYEFGSGDFAGVYDQGPNDLSQRLAEQIAERRLIGVSASVYRDDWEYGASKELKADHPSHYHFCLALALLFVSQVSKEFGDNQPVAVVFANQQEYKSYSVLIHEAFNKSVRWGNIGSLSFGEPRCVTQLQAADLFAYEIYQELKFQLKNVNEVPWRKPARSQLQTICRSLHIEGRIAGVPFLHACSNSMDDLASVVDAAKTASPS